MAVQRLRLGELGQAEEALAEANVLNNRHPMVWGELALLSLKTMRFDEAAQALGQAYKLGLQNAPLLTELSTALFAVGKWVEADGAARRAMVASPPTPAAHASLGDALMEQQRFEEALSEYKSCLALNPEAALGAHSRKQASQILQSHLGRPGEVAAL